MPIDPLKPHVYIVQLWFTGVYIIFLITAKNIDCGTRWNRLAEAVLMSTHNLVLSRNMKNIRVFYLKKNSFFLEVKFSIYLNRRVFVM